MKQIFVFLFSLSFSISLASQSTTTSSIYGKITDRSTLEELIGATVFAIHTPTGTNYGTTTGIDGSFHIDNMRVGGPYHLSITYTGYGEMVRKDVFLRLGECQKLNFELSSTVTQLTTIKITAKSGSAGENAGTSTQITASDLESLPTLNRNLSDYTRLTPQASTFGEGLSFAGTNNRYNAIYIDGAVNNDVFGLSDSGTNGGQTGISPFSMDIIDQVQVVISPYDVSFGGFAGGGINAVTKSGTNDWKGTAYYFMQNEKLAGETNANLAARLGEDFVPTKLDEFSKKTYGASIGGPIKKNKAFFFVNAEIQKDETPAPFEFDSYNGESTTTDLDLLRSTLMNNYDYDPGTFGNTSDQLDGLKIFAKLSFNLNKNNELSLRHQYTKAEQYNRNASNSTRINFSNNGVYFPSTTQSSAIELNSHIKENKSNNFILGFTKVKDDRDPVGSSFPYVLINDESGSIAFGSDQFSTANELNTTIFSLTDNFKIYKGKHTFTFGTHNEFYNIDNLFIRQNYGSYRFSSLNSFLNGDQATFYQRSYSLQEDMAGDGTAAANLKAMQLGIYAQDEISLSSKLTLTYGLRLDVPIINSDPDTDSAFNDNTLPILQENYAVAKDIMAGKSPEGQLMFSPRVGFIYDFKNNRKTIIKGGVGIFTSRIPFVWPGAMFSNNGLSIGSVNQSSIVGGVDFIPNVQDQYINPDFSIPSGQIDLFAADFKYPQVGRGNLAVSTLLPGGFEGTFEAIVTKTINNIQFTNVNSDPTVLKNWSGGPDNRSIYSNTSLDPTYSAVYVGSNTNEGLAYNFTVSLSKNFGIGLNANFAYTYGEAKALNEGTSSQNSSQWRGQINIDGRNNPVYGRSDYATRHRIISSLSYRLKIRKATTLFSLFYNGQVGSPYSYVYNGIFAGNINNETGSTSANRSLIWIPETASEINLVDYSSGGITISAAEQWDALDEFIKNDDYLNENRGGYAEKNGAFLPFASLFDFAVRQDFNLKIAGKKQSFQVSIDIFNAANLLNAEWGTVYSVPGDFNNYFLINFEGYEIDGTTPKFTYRNGNELGKDDLNINGTASRWKMRFGLRYSFN